MKDVRVEMQALLYDLGAFSKQPCTDEENKQFELLKRQKLQLPEGVYPYEQADGYYRLVKEDLTEEEINRLIMLKQTKYLYTIRNSMIFFVVLSVTGILISLLTLR